VTPNAQGRQLVNRHTYPIVLRLWLTYMPAGGTPRSTGYTGLRLP
jgi:hypothetical protein